MPKKPKIQVSASPYNYWWRSLPLPKRFKPSADEYLAEVARLDYAGTELGDGSILPLDPAELVSLLAKYGVQLAAGFWPTHLLTQDYGAEKKGFQNALRLLKLMGSERILVADFSFSVTDDLTRPVIPSQPPALDKKDWRDLGRRLGLLNKLAMDAGIPMAYHPHVGTIVNQMWEIDRLLENSPDLSLNLDTGHVALAGEDPLVAFNRYSDRITHLHLKNFRPEVVAQVQREQMSWQWAKINGAFTAVGDGGYDFKPIIERLKEIDYQGWIVLEIEQDPSRFNPTLYSALGRETLRDLSGW